MDGAVTVLLVGVVIIGALALLGVALRLALRIIGRGITGAFLLFAFAAEQGFIGIAVYFACWVFILPVMLILSLVVGFVVASSDGASASQPRPRASDEARWQEEDRRYEEHRLKLVERAHARANGAD